MSIIVHDVGAAKRRLGEGVGGIGNPRPLFTSIREGG